LGDSRTRSIPSFGGSQSRSAGTKRAGIGNDRGGGRIAAHVPGYFLSNTFFWACLFDNLWYILCGSGSCAARTSCMCASSAGRLPPRRRSSVLFLCFSLGKDCPDPQPLRVDQCATSGALNGGLIAQGRSCVRTGFRATNVIDHVVRGRLGTCQD